MKRLALLADLSQNWKISTDFNNDFPMPIFMGGQDETNSRFWQMLCVKQLKTTRGLFSSACWAQSET